MNFLREYNEECHILSRMQATIFEQSCKDNIPSFYFVKNFMYMEETKSLDMLSYDIGGLSREDLYQLAKNKTKMRGGQVFTEEQMHWIGYFYRTYSYLLNIRSSHLFSMIPISYLRNVYNPYHSLDIRKAIEKVNGDLNINFDEAKEEKIMALIRKIYSST